MDKPIVFPCKLHIKMVLLILMLSLAGCYPGLRKEATVPSEALEEITFFYPDFSDDMDRALSWRQSRTASNI